MADEEDIAALVIDNGSGMCKGKFQRCGVLSTLRLRRRDDVKAVRGIVFVGARDTGTSWALLGINSLGTIWFCCVDAGEMGIASTAAVNLCIHCIGAMVGILPRESNKERRTVNNNSSRSWPFIRQNRDQMNIEKYSDPYKSLYTSLVHQKCRRKQSNQLTQPPPRSCCPFSL